MGNVSLSRKDPIQTKNNSQMLQRLPNEILVKILSKTKLQTARQCRLLDSRFNNLIQRFELHKKVVDSLSVTFMDGDSYTIFTTLAGDNHGLGESYECYEEMITTTEKILHHKVRSVKTITMIGINVDDRLIDMIKDQIFSRKITGLQIADCFFKCDSTVKWFNFLRSHQWTDFCVLIRGKGTIIPIPETILNHVSISFVYCSDQPYSQSEAPIELPWLNDYVLKNWYATGKSFAITYVKAAFTLEGIRRIMKNFNNDKMLLLDLGLITNVTSTVIEATFTRVFRERLEFAKLVHRSYCL